MNWESILTKETEKHTDQDVFIKEVSSDQIAQYKVSDGAAILRINDNHDEFIIDLLIDQSNSDEMKTAILYHEIGHAYDFIAHKEETRLYFQKKLREPKFGAMRRRTELAAFDNCLKNLLDIYKSGWHEPLINTISRITVRSVNDPDADYRFAIAEIMKSEIWTKCVKVI